MQKNADNSVTLTEIEVKSLSKLLKACWETFSSLHEGSDVVGRDHYYALAMWDDTVQCEEHELEYYVPYYDNDMRAATVAGWLEAYGNT